VAVRFCIGALDELNAPLLCADFVMVNILIELTRVYHR